MSVKNILAATAVVAVTVGAFLSLGSSPAAAQPTCHLYPGAPHAICTNNGSPRPFNIGGSGRRCYFLPTTSNGAVNGLRKVCN